MGYEYGTHSKQFEIPNPHRVENVFIAICAATGILTGFGALLAARAAYTEHLIPVFGRDLFVAFVVLVAAVIFARRAMLQLRFFFGRGRPADLVPHLQGNESGEGMRASGQFADARELRETIRQNAVTYPVPANPVDTLIYSIVRDLVYSPPLTRIVVLTQFRNVASLVFVVGCFCVSLVGVGNRAALDWIASFYFFVTVLLVVYPLAAARMGGIRMNAFGVIGFVVASVVGPVVLAQAVPRTFEPFGGTIDFTAATFVILGAALTVSIALLLAGIANTVRPNTIAAAPFLLTPTMNVTPAQLFVELTREFKRLWVEDVPNRTYMRVPAETDGAGGAFEAHVIEETQPLADDIRPMTFARAVGLTTTRWLLVSDVLGAASMIAGCAFLWSWATSGRTDALLDGLSLVVVCAAALFGANRLWRRFEFKSRLYWVECLGNYARTSTELGSLLGDRVRTSRSAVNVEAMTLRVWVVEVDSVAFSVDKERDIVSLRGLPAEAERMCRHLVQFGEAQSSVVVPASATDLERVSMIGALNAAVNPAAMPAGVPPSIGIAGLANEPPDASPVAFCKSCGHRNSGEGPFCSACGVRF